jgi:hypothetical protein
MSATAFQLPSVCILNTFKYLPFSVTVVLSSRRDIMGEQAHPRRVAEWLLVEWPKDETEPIKYSLAQLGPQPLGLRRLARVARARWRVEEY